MTDEQAVGAFAALAHPTRFSVWRLLGPYGSEGLPAGVIGAHLGISPAGLSFHLGTMLAADLLSVRREHRKFIYAVRPGLPGVLSRALSAAVSEVGISDAGGVGSATPLVGDAMPILCSPIPDALTPEPLTSEAGQVVTEFI